MTNSFTSSDNSENNNSINSSSSSMFQTPSIEQRKQATSPPPLVRRRGVPMMEIRVPEDLFLPPLSTENDEKHLSSHLEHEEDNAAINLSPRLTLIQNHEKLIQSLRNVLHDSQAPSTPKYSSPPAIQETFTFDEGDDDDDDESMVLDLPSFPHKAAASHDDSATTWLSSCATDSFATHDDGDDDHCVNNSIVMMEQARDSPGAERWAHNLHPKLQARFEPYEYHEEEPSMHDLDAYRGGVFRM